MGAAISSLCRSEQEVFMEAASKGNTALVNEILSRKGKQGARVNTRDKDGFSALHLASESGQVGTVKALLEKQAKVDMATDVGFTALNLAAKSGNDAIVKILIEAKSSLETADTAYGCTALLWAVQYCNCDTVRRLLEAGAKVEVKSRFGSTPLMLAAEAGAMDKVKALLVGGANPKAKDSRGATAMSKARDKGHRQVAEELQSVINKIDGVVEDDKEVKSPRKEKEAEVTKGKAATAVRKK